MTFVQTPGPEHGGHLRWPRDSVGCVAGALPSSCIWSREPRRPAGFLGRLAEALVPPRAPLSLARSGGLWSLRRAQKGQPCPGGGSASLCTAFAFGLPVPSMRGFLSGVNDTPLANGLVGAMTGMDKIAQRKGRRSVSPGILTLYCEDELLW